MEDEATAVEVDVGEPVETAPVSTGTIELRLGVNPTLVDEDEADIDVEVGAAAELALVWPPQMSMVVTAWANQPAHCLLGSLVSLQPIMQESTIDQAHSPSDGRLPGRHAGRQRHVDRHLAGALARSDVHGHGQIIAVLEGQDGLTLSPGIDAENETVADRVRDGGAVEEREVVAEPAARVSTGTTAVTVAAIMADGLDLSQKDGRNRDERRDGEQVHTR